MLLDFSVDQGDNYIFLFVFSKGPRIGNYFANFTCLFLLFRCTPLIPADTGLLIRMRRGLLLVLNQKMWIRSVIHHIDYAKGSCCFHVTHCQLYGYLMHENDMSLLVTYSQWTVISSLVDSYVLILSDVHIYNFFLFWTHLDA